ncbi:hypothetical protein FRC04_007017 [Tulasnella sp. 424]|nr:hypothetical protein FRC04_007017 [Tulasnella sp. 424]KAG8973058.1 hypothetical protein FRC05_009173 [Tulasnella sp. 425]
MRYLPPTSSPARRKTLVAKTRKVIGVVTKVFKHAETDKPLFTHALEVAATFTEELESELFYPAPFSRTFTSASQLSDSTGSTPRSSMLFSRQTSQTIIAVPEPKMCPEKAPQGGTTAPTSQPISNRNKNPFISILEEEENDCIDPLDYQDSDDDEVLYMRCRRGTPHLNSFATSLPYDPYAAFLSHPSYKPPYTFPTLHRSVNPYYS